MLQFRAERVDKVVFVASSGDIPFFFMAAAESQGYHPAYGLSSADAPFFLAANEPESQMKGARLVGWNAQKDYAQTTRWTSNPTWSRCSEAMAKRGFTEAASGFLCDPFLFLQKALNRSKSVSASAMRAAVDGLGGSLTLAEPYVTRFDPARTSATGAVRHLAYAAGCKCFQPLGGPRAIPR